MADNEEAKRRAARAAADLVEDGMTIGLGSGTTASLVLQRLADRIRTEGLRIAGVPTSETTAALARQLGVPLRDLDDVDQLDLDVDGADEVDPRFRMIKGRGGALLREKIVAAAARRRVIAVTAGKRVDRLGAHCPVPVEVNAFGWRHSERAIRTLGATTQLRVGADDAPWITDGGNRIVDCRFPAIDDPEQLDVRLKQIPGVLETGLFVGLCDLLVVGYPDRVEVVESGAG